MRRSGDDTRLARALASADYAVRREGVEQFVRSLGMSAPVALTNLALEHPEACLSYDGSRPLAAHLLDTLPLAADVAAAWRVALLEGEALRSAIAALDVRVGPEIRAILNARGLDGDGAWQAFIEQLIAKRSLRQSCLGKYSGRGDLAAYLLTAVSREATRLVPRRDRGEGGPDDPLELLAGANESPSEAVERREMLDRIAAVLADVADDPGLTLFLLQQQLDLAPTQVARVFRLRENVVRQRTFRFRERFRRAWKSRYGGHDLPIAGKE